MKKAVMYGGGNIGRGFIGALLSQAGYAVTFIDVAEPVVEALSEKHTYPIRYVDSNGFEDVWIHNVTAVNGNDTEAAAEAIAQCDLMATAVGARILKFIVPNIAAGLRKRWQSGKEPLDILICENLNDANKVLEELLKAQLTGEERKRFDETVGLVEASIGRMVPVQTEEMKDGEPMRVCVERYGFLPVQPGWLWSRVSRRLFGDRNRGRPVSVYRGRGRLGAIPGRGGEHTVRGFRASGSGQPSADGFGVLSVHSESGKPARSLPARPEMCRQQSEEYCIDRDPVIGCVRKVQGKGSL